MVRINPAALNANEENVVTLATEHGRVTTTFVADPTVREGVVSMTHGHPDANPGNLTSGNEDVDPLTAMPRVAGLVVAAK